MLGIEKGFSVSAAMNARIKGSGNESIVLAHGYGADQSFWDRITPCLAGSYRVLVFDWNFSDQKLYDSDSKYSSFDAFADDLIALLDEFRLRGSVYMGHSMSGMIGCIASVKRPDLFKRLVLIGASPRYLNEDNYVGGFESSEIDHMLSNIESNFTEWTSYFASLIANPKNPLAVDKYEKSLREMRPQVALSIAKTVFGSDHRHILEKVTIPCTIIQPTNDAAVPNSVAEYMQKNIKGETTIQNIHMDGHFPHLTAHVQFLKVLDDVLGFHPDVELSYN